jgi:TonB family protein
VRCFLRAAIVGLLSGSFLLLGQTTTPATGQKSETLGSTVEQAAKQAAKNRTSTAEEGRCLTSRNGASILTDTMGVDFDQYLTRTTKIVRQNWYNLMPPSVYPPILKQGKVSIEFFILKNGKLDGMKIHAPSGDVALDRSAWASITASIPFAPLPEEFPGQKLGLRFYFYYNLAPPISISPSAHVRVSTGSTLQFSASGEGITNTSVTWSLSGPGCLKSTCGTISLSGLYTAPITIPHPPSVQVEVASISDSGIRACSTITVVEPGPSP